MSCHNGRGCHLSLARVSLSVAVCRGLFKGWLGLLHGVRLNRGLRKCCFQGSAECDV